MAAAQRAAGRRVGWLAAALVLAGGAGCAGWEDFDPPVQSEIPEGPGVFSGPRGEFAVEMDVRRGDEDEDEESEESRTEPDRPGEAGEDPGRAD